eukprot:10396508-Alexandrium_andersonii.AAC.1
MTAVRHYTRVDVGLLLKAALHHGWLWTSWNTYSFADPQIPGTRASRRRRPGAGALRPCLLYTSDAADDM